MTGGDRVAHYVAQYPAPTQTFIEPLLARSAGFVPEIWTIEVGTGPDPSDIEVRRIPEARGRFRRIRTKLLATIRGFEFREEYRFSRALAEAPARPSLVHAHFGPQGYASARACRRAKVPLVCTFYGFDVGLADSPQWKRRYSLLWTVARLVFVEGPEMRRRLIAAGAPGDLVRVLPLAIDPDAYEWAPRTYDPEHRLVLLVVGRMVEKKGIDDAIRVVERIVRAGFAVELRIVGDGPLMTAHHELVSSLELDDVVVFRGSLSHDETKREMNAAHLLLQPSRMASNGDTEGGAPYGLLEGQLLGLCVVASRHADIPNVVCPDAYFSFEESDLDGFERSLLEAIGLAAEWAERAQVARAWVVDRHDRSKIVEQLTASYRQVIG